MKKVFYLLLAATLCTGCNSSKKEAAQQEEAVANQPVLNQNFYQISVTQANGQPVKLENYQGQVLLIVNTATHCGFTLQYAELEHLYADFQKEGFTILDFPCNQFGNQAPGSIEEIHNFCTANYDIHFPQFAKIDVNGEQASPLFTYLKSVKGFEGLDAEHRLSSVLEKMFDKQLGEGWRQSPDIKWNFTKFLIDRQGNVVARFEPTHDLNDIAQQIKALL